MLTSEICVAITNYDFSDNSEKLKRSFSNFYHTILIDASSPKPPKNADITIPNTYYPGLWNAAVNYAHSNGFKWLMFIASDIEINDVATLCLRAFEVTQIEEIGIYSPSLTPNSRASYDLQKNRPYHGIREVGFVEGFFFLARMSILQTQYPVPSQNIYGWGHDVSTSYAAYLKKYHVVVDDKVMIFHPNAKKEHEINNFVADKTRYVKADDGIYNWLNTNLESIRNSPKIFSTMSSPRNLAIIDMHNNNKASIRSDDRLAKLITKRR